MSRSAVADPVVVVGGGLAGMAAAARLAKSGHPVQLIEAEDRLGGSWAVRQHVEQQHDQEQRPEVAVDAAPGVLHFPAPWRDLFRKSGRPLEAELSRLGLELAPAPPAHYLFADGSRLVLPAERGEQHAALSAAYGEPVALRWRDLLDSLDDVWQAVRPLGLESELRDKAQLTAARRRLRPRQSIADLAAELAEPHLGAVLASVAYRLGSRPERTPAWCAVELAVQRTFGRWLVRPQDHAEAAGRSSLLTEALAARLALRRVTVQLGRRVTGLRPDSAGRIEVSTDDGRTVVAAAVVCTVDPWQAYEQLLPAQPWRDRRRLRRWQPALAPAVEHHLSPGGAGQTGEPGETVALSPSGVPTVTYARPTAHGTLHSVHDHGRATPRRSAGIAWDGLGSWLDRPPIRSAVPGIVLAGPCSPGGPTPSAVLLSGALAAYAVQAHLDAGSPPVRAASAPSRRL